MKLIGDRQPEIRVRIVVDSILQGRLGEAAESGILLVNEDLVSLQLLEPSARDDVIQEVAHRLVSMMLPGYDVRFSSNPRRPELEIFKR